MLQNSLQSELTTGKFYPVDCLTMQPMVLEETPLPHVEDFCKTPHSGHRNSVGFYCEQISVTASAAAELSLKCKIGGEKPAEQLAKNGLKYLIPFQLKKKP